VFICYRQDDGKSAARWLADHLHNLVLPFVPDGHDSGPTLDVYFDELAPAVDDWTRIHLPALERARVFILVCSPGASRDFGERDWVHKELRWWLERRNVPPLVICSLDASDRWVPDVIKERWPRIQRTLVRPDYWAQQTAAIRQPEEESVLARVLGGIRASEIAVRDEDYERAREQAQAVEHHKAIAHSHRRHALVLAAVAVILLLISVTFLWRASVARRESIDALEEQLSSSDSALVVSSIEQLVSTYGASVESVVKLIPAERISDNHYVALLGVSVERAADRDGTVGFLRRSISDRIVEVRQGVQRPPSWQADSAVNPRVRIEGGRFRMGLGPDDGNNKPVHSVRLSTFFIQAHEVTNAEYERFHPGHADVYRRLDPRYLITSDQPVVNVSWYDAMAYAVWLGGSLPTEAQWEFTARGEDHRRYPWDMTGRTEPDCDRANTIECGKGLLPVTPSRELGKTPEGVYDLAGNVMEWCLDFEGPYAGRPDDEWNPKGPRTGQSRVIRGNSAGDRRDMSRPIFRFGSGAEAHYNKVGIRVAFKTRTQ
jgi:formylglycine-generating enzyme required for sulfatase activity